MTTLTMNRTRPAVNAHRARIVGDAVTWAYIREIASAAAPGLGSTARPTAGRAPAATEVGRIAIDHRPPPLRRLKDSAVVTIRRRPASPLAARQLRIAAGAPALADADIHRLDAYLQRQIESHVRDVAAGHACRGDRRAVRAVEMDRHAAGDGRECA